MSLRVAVLPFLCGVDSHVRTKARALGWLGAVSASSSWSPFSYYREVVVMSGRHTAEIILPDVPSEPREPWWLSLRSRPPTVGDLVLPAVDPHGYIELTRRAVIVFGVFAGVVAAMGLGFLIGWVVFS